MQRKLIRCALVSVLFWGLLAPTGAQDRRDFFKPPETTAEYWRAVNFEVNVGRYDLAAEYLKALLSRNPTDEDLLKIEERDGLTGFLRLATIPQTRVEGVQLLQRVENAVQKVLGDPKRIDALIRKLYGDEEERAFAIGQLRRVGPRAVPALIAALQRTQDENEAHTAILTAMIRLNRDILPPLVAALDISNSTLKLELLEVINQRGDVEAAPFLWYTAGSAKEPEIVRQKAAAVLARFLETSTDKLPPAKTMLTREAERYYQHKVRFLNPDRVVVWRWDGKELTGTPVPVSTAEEYHGLRFARQALEVDPQYEPAQIVFLSLALDKGFERVGGVDQPLSKAADVRDLVVSVNPELVVTVLERGLKEKRTAVVLGATRALGDLAEVRAVRPRLQGEPALVRALNYPDRRVQVAAADALLRIPSPTGKPIVPSRVVEVLRRAVAADAQPRVLIADFRKERRDALAAALKQAGYESVAVGTGREAMQRLNEAADIDAIILDSQVPDPGLLYQLAQLRADVHSGQLPVIVVAPADQVERYQRLTAQFQPVTVQAPSLDPALLKQDLDRAILAASGQPLTAAEKEAQTGESLIWLARLAHGEPPGYDLRPATPAILRAMQNDKLAMIAIDIAGHLPGRDAQRALAAYVLNAMRPVQLRARAALELTRHLQEHSITLTPDQIAALEALYATADDPGFKGTVAVVLGGLRPTAKQTGERLQRYVPALTAPAPAAKEDAPTTDTPKVQAKEPVKEK